MKINIRGRVEHPVRLCDLGPGDCFRWPNDTKWVYVYSETLWDDNRTSYVGLATGSRMKEANGVNVIRVIPVEVKDGVVIFEDA